MKLLDDNEQSIILLLEQRADEHQVVELNVRFIKLREGAVKRMQDLENAKSVAKAFNDQFDLTSKSLKNLEGKLKAAGISSVDEKELNKNSEIQQAVYEEIEGILKPQVLKLTESAVQLKGLFDPDEVKIAEEKCNELDKSTQNLSDECNKFGLLIITIRQLILRYSESCQCLTLWCDDFDSKLKIFREIPSNSDGVDEEVRKLQDFQQGIAPRKTDLQQLSSVVNELAPHIPTNDAFKLKSKVDLLAKRLTDLSTAANGELSKHQQVGNYEQDFTAAQKSLEKWIIDADKILSDNIPGKYENVMTLESEIESKRALLETINSMSQHYGMLLNRKDASILEEKVTKLNRQFESTVEKIQRTSERLKLILQRTEEISANVDETLYWFKYIENVLANAPEPCIEPEVPKEQLANQRQMNDDINNYRGRVKEINSSTQKIAREIQLVIDDFDTFREKLEELKRLAEATKTLSSERLSILEQVQPLSDQYADVHGELESWLTEMEKEVVMLTSPGLNSEQVMKQQENNERLMLQMDKEKTVFERLCKIIAMLSPLVSRHDAVYLKETEDGLNERYSALKNEIRENQFALEKAMLESSQFADRLDNMLKTLINIEDQIRKSSDIPASPQKITTLLSENSSLIDDYKKRLPAVESVKTSGIEIIAKSPESDESTFIVKKKLSQMNSLCPMIEETLNNREKILNQLFNLSEKFWMDYDLAINKLNDVKDTLSTQENIAIKPDEIERQVEEFKEVSHSIEPLQEEVNDINKLGMQLHDAVSPSERPDIKKNIDELNSLFESIRKLQRKRENELELARKYSVQFIESLDTCNLFLTTLEGKIQQFQPIGGEFNAIKGQIDEVKDLRQEIDANSVLLSNLHQNQLSLHSRGISPDQQKLIESDVNSVNERWRLLIISIRERMKQLEVSLLEFGHLEHVITELLAWLVRTKQLVDQARPIPGDDKVLEIEIAKFKVVSNDIEAHRGSFENIIQNHDPSSAQIAHFSNAWMKLQSSAEAKEKELYDELSEAQNFNSELQEVLFWLTEIDDGTNSLKPTGGLLETAQEQMFKFEEVHADIESHRSKVESMISQGENYARKHLEMKVTMSSLQPTIKILRQRWEGLLTRLGVMRLKFETSLKDAENFHASLDSFKAWLTATEEKLTKLEPISSNTPKTSAQLEATKALQNEVESRREQIKSLDKDATDLKLFCQKQDFIVIHNQIVTVQHRWEILMSSVIERYGHLNQRVKMSQTFYDSYNSLMIWLREIEVNMKSMQSQAEVQEDPVRVKDSLGEIRNSNHEISNRQKEFDFVVESGKHLMAKSDANDDIQDIDRMLQELKVLWQTVCLHITEVQRILETKLIVYGQFNESLHLAIEWLRKAEMYLTDLNVFGNVEIVTHLYEVHNRFKEEISSRSSQMNGLLACEKARTATGIEADQVKIANELWMFVQENCKQKRVVLDEAFKDAEQMQTSYEDLMMWCNFAEKFLKEAKMVATNELELKQIKSEFEVFSTDYRQKEFEKTEALVIAENILKQSHPDAIRYIKMIISTIIQRWEQITQWTLMRERRISKYSESFKNMDGSVEALIAWLSELEEKLVNWELEELSEDITIVEELSSDHKTLMESSASRQSEIDNICKPKKPKPPVKVIRSIASRLPPNRLLPVFSDARTFIANKGLPVYGPTFAVSSANEISSMTPRSKFLWEKWRCVWLQLWNRQKRLYEHVMILRDREKMRNFDWEDWRKRYLKFMGMKRTKVIEFLKKIDRKQNGLIPKDVFVNETMKLKAPTERAEVQAVAEMFDTERNGTVDWEEFLIALKPEWKSEAKNPGDTVHEEVRRLVMLCTCRQKFRVFQVGEGKYRFGAEQKLRLVRILRSTVMVRVGGGWMALDEFLLKNDPCRAQGRTNVELREEFVLAAGTTQSMQAFTPKRYESSSSAGQSSSTKVRSGSTADSDNSDTISLGRRTPSSRIPSVSKMTTSSRSNLTASSSKIGSRQLSSASLISEDGTPKTKIPTRIGMNVTSSASRTSMPTSATRRTVTVTKTTTTYSLTKTPTSTSKKPEEKKTPTTIPRPRFR